MTVASDFASYWAGFELTAANYSGGAGGTFTNLAGGPDWEVQGGTPTFSTIGAREGMNFTGNANQSIFGDMFAARNLTMVVAWSQSVATPGMLIGGTSPSGNTFGANVNGSRIQVFYPPASTGFLSGAVSLNTPLCAAFTISGKHEKCAVKVAGTALVEGSATSNLAPNWPQIGIGRHRTTYLNNANISAVYLFGDPLIYSAPTELESFLTDLAATL